MLSTTELWPAVPSSLVDLRDMPLNEISGLNASAADEVITRILAEESPVAPVPVAIFQSAI